MKTNEFRVKEINDDKIVLEEERDKKHGIIWLFFKKYGRMLNMVLSLVAFIVLLIGMSLSYDIFLDNAKKIYIIDEKEFLKFTSNNLTLDNLIPTSNDKVDDEDETIVTLSNTSSFKKIDYLLVVSEILHEDRISPSELLYSLSVDGGKNYTEPNVLNARTISGLQDTDYVLYEGSLEQNSDINIRLRVWIPETGVDQNHLQGKLFKGKLNIYYKEA
ncbi:MAG: hypothetical protein ACI4VR_02775 [Bacilli bacterium]